MSLASDASYSYGNLWTVLPGYTALAFHGVVSIALEQTQSVFPQSVTPQMVTAASALGSCFLAVPLYAFRTFMVGCGLGMRSFCRPNKCTPAREHRKPVPAFIIPRRHPTLGRFFDIFHAHRERCGQGPPRSFESLLSVVLDAIGIYCVVWIFGFC